MILDGGRRGIDVISAVGYTKNIFVEFKSGDELQRALQEEQRKPVLTDLLGNEAMKFGSVLTQLGYIVDKVPEEKIPTLQSHPAVANIYEKEIPVERIAGYLDCGMQAGASVWNGRFGKKGMINGTYVDAKFLNEHR